MEQHAGRMTALVAELEKAADATQSLAVQRRIEQDKKDTEIELLRVRLATAPAPGYRIVFPNALCASSAASTPVMFWVSSTGFTSTRSMATMLARSANISMARCASR